jgi:hypothetical protein
MGMIAVPKRRRKKSSKTPCSIGLKQRCRSRKRRMGLSLMTGMGTTPTSIIYHQLCSICQAGACNRAQRWFSTISHISRGL